ncbi:MAG: cyanase [Cyanophyceae cyanobacterium]
MAISEITQTLLAAKKAKGLTYEALEKVIGQDEVWIAAVIFRQASADMEQAKALVDALGLPEEMAEPLTVPPLKGSLEPVIPTDPLIYRLYEIMQVYGMPVKDVIHEKFGDGIMSAIDFSLEVDMVPDPKGDRVQITMCGKFLPYKKW